MRKKTSGSIEGRPCWAAYRGAVNSRTNARSRTRSIRRRKWSAATNDSKSMLALALGSNACTPCMAAPLLEYGRVSNETTPETRTKAKNQAESETDKVLFFNTPNELLRRELQT